MRVEQETKLDFKDVLIRPKRSTIASRKQVDLYREMYFRNSKRSWKGVPIMASNMDGVGTPNMARALSKEGMFTCLVKTTSNTEIDTLTRDIGSGYFAVSTGTSEQDFENLKAILTINNEIPFICIDVANGYSEHFADFVGRVRVAFPNHIIIAGNVVTADMTQELILRGADIIKVGIGPGAVCTTRIQTGVGYPQLSAIAECADAAHGLGGHIIADGGCTCPGDVAKAFGAGADFVMLGGMLAGHDEGGGTVIQKWMPTGDYIFDPNLPVAIAPWPNLEEKKFIQFYGMSSETAMNKHHGGVAEYRSSEGRTVEVKYRGPVEATVRDILGGLRSTCSYVGAQSIKHLSKCTTFVRTNRQFNDVFVK